MKINTTNGMTLTNRGHEILALALAGKNLKFTCAKAGDGVLNDEQDPAELSDLINPRQTMEIKSISASKTGTCEIVTLMTNKELTSGYFVREYGVFAEHPETHEELLYSYANKGDKCSYLEGDNGIFLINYALSLITVVDKAPNITAVLNDDYSFVTMTQLNSRFADQYAEGITPAGFWSFAPDGDYRLRPLSLDDTRRALLGTHDIPAMINRLEHLEDNLAEILLAQEELNILPDYTHFILEDFKFTDQADIFNSKITSIITGDDSIDCENLTGIFPGAWYTITDGIHSENVQVQSINNENNIQRVILYDPVKFTYMLDYCRIYRTSANINPSVAKGTMPRAAFNFFPALKWSGRNSGENFSVSMNTNLSNTNAFSLSGNATFDAEGFIILR